ASGFRQAIHPSRNAAQEAFLRNRPALAPCQRVGDLFPGCPMEEQPAIAEHACQKSSSRIGMSAAAKELPASAVDLAVRTHVRHIYGEGTLFIYDRPHAAGDAGRGGLAA